MAQLEARHTYPYIHSKALLFPRYIDDIFMIWNGNAEELILFIDEVNKKHKTIKFDYKMSTKQRHRRDKIETSFRQGYSQNHEKQCLLNIV